MHTNCNYSLRAVAGGREPGSTRAEQTVKVYSFTRRFPCDVVESVPRGWWVDVAFIHIQARVLKKWLRVSRLIVGI